jgi:teichuronic acid biosynthesis glycosyltransferase TuaG
VPRNPLVSVIMPVFNAAPFVVATVDSVLRQSLSDWELIAVDDSSTDSSADVLAGLARRDPRIRVVTVSHNLGAGAARNIAMDCAAGRWLAFLDADDLWHPAKLERQIAAMETAAIPISCTAYCRVDQVTGHHTLVGVPRRATRIDLLKTNTVACSTAMIDRAFVGSMRMGVIRRRQDYLFWLELLKLTPEILGVGQVLMTYRRHSGSLSARKLSAAADNWNMYRNELGLPVLPASWYFANYALRGVMRHRLPSFARSLGVLHRAEDP